ncbi:DUF6988 family protein [Vibrio owensii]|uniref:DUF6988 family protein n=1 Tax=Vibrio owensii TaxID=696485 RepID=UPI00148B83C1|nr:hypothetical protein [Vibrio owensii]
MYKETDRWIQSLKSLTSKLQPIASNRNRLALALMYTSNTHCCSIQQLISKNLPSSAFALARSQVETYLRAIWVFNCANTEQINKILHGGNFPKKHRILEQLMELDEFKDSMLKENVDKMWSTLCDFTHGGGIQSSWHIGRNTIGDHYGHKQIKELLKLTCKISLLNALAMAKVSDAEDVSNKLLLSYRRIHK